MVDLPASVNIPNSVLFQHMGNEYVLLNTQTETYFGLDEVAAMFWQSLSDGLNIHAAVEKVLSEYEVDRETLEKDLGDLLQKLESHQLLTFEK